jgi:hypothetical protein
MIILGTNSIKDTGFNVANSCRFNTASTTHMERSSPDDHTSTKKFTISFWIKRTTLGTNQVIFGQRGDAENAAIIKFKTNDTLEINDLRDDSDALQVVTNRQFLDVSAWYNIVISSDVDTGSPELKVFVNGVQETSFATTNQYSQDETTSFNNSYNMWIGETGHGDSNGDYFSGYLSEFVFIDGYAYNADSFGEFDDDSKIWKPIDVSTLTSGTNVCYMQFEDSSDLGVNSRNDDFTPTNLDADHQSIDTCTNNFPVINPLDNNYAGGTFAEGNLQITTRNTGYSYNTATIGVATGKWYWEVKWSAQDTGSTNQVVIGIAKRPVQSTAVWLGSVAWTYSYQGSDGKIKLSDSDVITYDTYSVGDIIGVALDMDNNRLYFSKNGTFQNSSDPANGTNPISITAADSTSGDSGFYFPAFGDGNNNLVETGQFNFGYPIHSISSGNADANGYGNFEYAVPSGYYSICTKNIAEFT